VSRRASVPAALRLGPRLAFGLALLTSAGCATLLRARSVPPAVPPPPSSPPTEQGWTGPAAEPEPPQEPPAPEEPPAPPVAAEPPRPGQGEVPEEDKPTWMRGLKRPDIPLRWYPKTTRYLLLYKTDPRYREIMRGWLRRFESHRVPMEAALQRQGLPRGLIFVAMIESGFSSSALSNRGAGGFWQFRSDVARGYGLEVSFWVDERRDLSKSTAAAAIYLGDLYHRFGSWELALAGYNAGFHAVLTSVLRFNSNDFWTLSQLEAGLPWETTEYVPKVLAVGVVESNRQVFGFEAGSPSPPRPSVEVEVAGGVTFEAIAARAGVSVDELAALNPAYLRKRTPPDRPTAPVRVPPDKTRGLADLRMADVAPLRVRPGESLARIAKDRKVPRDRLRRLNGVTDDADVTAGTLILIPRASAKPAARAPGRS
jgi:membrane-bound lytic murein transglycosylase D